MIAKKALAERTLREMNRPYEMTYGIADATVQSIATIVGFGLGGFLAAWLLSRVGLDRNGRKN